MKSIIFSCISDLYVPKGTTLFVQFAYLDMPTDVPNKCRKDYLRIKGSNKSKFYCGTLNKVKVKEMGPWGKDYRFQFSFRTNNDDTNGDGAKLYLYAKATRTATELKLDRAVAVLG